MCRASDITGQSLLCVAWWWMGWLRLPFFCCVMVRVVASAVLRMWKGWAWARIWLSFQKVMSPSLNCLVSVFFLPVVVYSPTLSR